MGLKLPKDLSNCQQSLIEIYAQGLNDNQHSGFLVKCIGPEHAERTALQEFIADIFFKMYGAQVNHFCHTLVGCQSGDGKWVAALGLSFAKDGPTFLEQYLDSPLQDEIAARVHVPVPRNRIVEVGNLASTHAGAARSLIVYMTRYLHQQGLEWVAFTATKGLLNSFSRLRIAPQVLAAADPLRLPDGGKNWGRYYQTKPQVMFASIGNGYARLAE